MSANDFSELVAHHREVRAARVKLLIPAILTAFGPVTMGLAMLVGWGESVWKGPDPQTVAKYAKLGMAPPSGGFHWDPNVFNDKGRLLLGVGAALLVVAGLVLLVRVLKRASLRNGTPELVEWLGRGEPLRRVVIESQIFADIQGEYAVASSAPVIVAENGSGRKAELEIGWSQVGQAQALLQRWAPGVHVAVDLKR